jgi:hypothetical protein
MTPKEKAIDLVDKFNQYTVKASTHYPNGKMVECKDDAKQCALIAVDEIIEQCEFDVIHDVLNQRYMGKLNYWDEVKQEIENL